MSKQKRGGTWTTKGQPQHLYHVSRTPLIFARISIFWIDSLSLSVDMWMLGSNWPQSKGIHRLDTTKQSHGEGEKTGTKEYNLKWICKVKNSTKLKPKKERQNYINYT